MAPDVPASFEMRMPAADYVRREVMIPMRDGVRLHTVIADTEDAQQAPMVLSRTPYSANGRSRRNDSPSLLATGGQGDEVLVGAGYIRVFRTCAASTARKAIT
jgi:predicted acyl esterase